LQVGNQTVVVAGAVAVINSLQPMAGKVGALEAKSYLSSAQFDAVSFDVGALFLARAAANTTGNPASFSGNFSGIGKVSTANPAVHPARGN